MAKKMFGLHKDDTGNVLGAFEFESAYDLAGHVRALDIRDGDWVDFKEVVQRKSPDADAVRLAFLEDVKPEQPCPPGDTDAALADEQPF